MEATAPPTAPALPSFPARVLQVFFSPGQLYEALKENPAWFGALLLSGILAAGSVLVIPPDMMVEAARQQLIAQGSEIPPGFDSMAMVFRITGAVGGMLGPFIGAFVMAGIMKLVFNFLFGGEGRYKQYLSVVSYGMIVAVIGGVLILPLKIAQADPTLTLNVGTFFFFLEEGYAFRVLKLLDLFGLWGSTVMAIGVTKVDPKRSLGVALAFFYGISIVFALIFGIFGG